MHPQRGQYTPLAKRDRRIIASTASVESGGCGVVDMHAIRHSEWGTAIAGSAVKARVGTDRWRTSLSELFHRRDPQVSRTGDRESGPAQRSRARSTILSNSWQRVPSSDLAYPIEPTGGYRAFLGRERAAVAGIFHICPEQVRALGTQLARPHDVTTSPTVPSNTCEGARFDAYPGARVGVRFFSGDIGRRRFRAGNAIGSPAGAAGWRSRAASPACACTSIVVTRPARAPGATPLPARVEEGSGLRDQDWIPGDAISSSSWTFIWRFNSMW